MCGQMLGCATSVHVCVIEREEKRKRERVYCKPIAYMLSNVVT